MKYLYTLIEIVLIGIVLYSGFNIYKWYEDVSSNNRVLKEIKNEKIETIAKDINEDTVAKIVVKNTKINYPIVKGSDNSYYLNHNINGEVNKAGWIFMDYRNEGIETDKNIIIYGHNMKDNSMFGSLKTVLKKEWYENKKNHIIKLTWEGKTHKYQIFSAYTIEVEEYYTHVGFDTDEEFQKFINKLSTRSFTKYDVDLTDVKQILTLSTCSGQKSRMVVHAKRID